MIEDIAKITEARGIQPGSPGVDVIVWVAKDVPHAVYLDETYAFRVSRIVAHSGAREIDTASLDTDECKDQRQMVRRHSTNAH